MAVELSNSVSAGTAFNVIALAACAAAVLLSGGMAAALAGVVAIASLTGSFVVSIAPIETPCEQHIRECNEATAPRGESARWPELETCHSRHWRQHVEDSRQGGRSR